MGNIGGKIKQEPMVFTYHPKVSYLNYHDVSNIELSDSVIKDGVLTNCKFVNCEFRDETDAVTHKQ